MSTVHLNRYFHFTELMRDPAIEFELKRYRAGFDGTMQSLLVMRPSNHHVEKTFYFFHGMDGDCGDVVILRELVKQQSAMVVALGGRGPAWLADSVIADATHTMRNIIGVAEEFYLIGVSMGGTQVLSLAGLLPKDLRDAVKGVVALIPGSNLEVMANNSTHERVRNTISSSGSDLRLRSPINLLDKYKPELPFVIFYNEGDSLLGSEELEIYISELRANGHPVATFSEPGNHNFTFANFDYDTLMRQLGSDISIQGAPLLTK